MPFSSITGWGSQKMNVLLILMAGSMLAGAEIKLKSNDFKPAKNAEMVEVFEATKVELKSGSILKIELPLSLGTGYQWELLGPDHGPLTFQQVKTLPPAQPRPGAGTVQQFEFKAKAQPSGSSSQVMLVFNLRRSFEGVGNKFYQVRIVVGEP
jgi:predicted secreted protein